MTTDSERFGLLVRILESNDYAFIQHRNPSIAKRFRRDRLRIFRRELRDIAADSVETYQKRVSRISAAGQWSAYGPLVRETASVFVSLGKLSLAGTLFSWRIPVMINAGINVERLVKYFANDGAYGSPRNLHA